MFKLRPLAIDFLDGRDKADLLVQLWDGDVTDQVGAAVMEDRVEAVTSIEIIEHLERFDRFSKLTLK